MDTAISSWKTIVEKMELTADQKKFIVEYFSARFENGILNIAAPSSPAKRWLERYIDALKTAARGVYGDCEINIYSKIEVSEKPEPVIIQKSEKIVGVDLNPEYGFHNYYEGDFNKFAVTVVKKAIEKPGEVYNPVLIYGGYGVGKTHLLQAAGNFLKQKAHVGYFTAEAFVNRFIKDLQEKKLDEFRNSVRALDCILIDDIQFFSEKWHSQEEFFYTFDALRETRKQIILSSDRPPKELDGIDERIISRFVSGVVCDIKGPSFEEKVGILIKKAESQNIAISMDVIQAIAERSDDAHGIRGLEGNFRTVVSYALAIGVPLTIEVVEKVLKKEYVAVTPEKIISVVSEYYHITPAEIKSKKRTSRIVIPRQVAMYLLRELTELSIVEIGEYLGGRDHSTVLHGINKVEELLEKDAVFNIEVNNLRKKITGE